MELKKFNGGELLVPKLSSYRIMDLAKAVHPECGQKIVGIRPGEKIHEEMIQLAIVKYLELKKFY